MNSPLANSYNGDIKKIWLEMAEDSITDDSMFDDEDFENELASHIVELVATGVKPYYIRISKAWRELGLTKKWRQERISDIITTNVNINAEIAMEEEKSLKKMHDVKNTKERELQDLINELGEERFEPQPNLTLMGTARSFYIKCEELRALKESRLKEWVSLKNIKSQLHIILGIGENGEAHGIPYNVPHVEDILKLKNYVETLEEQKQSRFKNFITLRKSVLSLFEQLELEPGNEFEKELVCSDVSKFILSMERIKKVTELYHKLQIVAEENIKRRKQLMDKLNSLWEILDFSVTDKTVFKTCNCGAKPSTLKNIEAEIEKLEQVKRENMGLFIQRMRPEITNLWDKCFVGPKHREFFSDYFTDTDFNDELLEIHERELEKYRRYYEEAKDILIGVEKYNKMWERFLELEVKATDPSRLKNRGGALLKEGSERSKLQKDIPKLESTLILRSQSWSDNHGREKIYVNDISLENYFENRWNEFTQHKELEKKIRQLQKKKDLQAEAKGFRSMQKNQTGIVLRRTPVKQFHALNNQGTSSSKRLPLSPVNQVVKPKKCNRNLEPFMMQGFSNPKVKKTTQSVKKDSDTYSLEDFQENDLTHVTHRRNRGNVAENTNGYGKLDKRKSKSCTLLNTHDFKNLVDSPVRAYIRSNPCSPKVLKRRR